MFNANETRIITDVFSIIAQQLREQEPKKGVSRPYAVNLRFSLSEEEKHVVESIVLM